MNAAMQLLGAHLRQMRQELGWSLNDVERKSSGRWKTAVVGSYERGHRNASWAQALALIEFYNVRRVELLETADVVVRASEHGAGDRVEYVVTAPGLARPIECCDRDEAIACAALVAGGVAGYRTVGAVRPIDRSLPQQVAQLPAEAASPANDRGGAA